MKSKYEYLLDQKIITTADLKRAHQIARQTNKSAEAILVVHFRVTRKALGRSLSDYYECPFRVYDSSLPISLAFLTGLKKSVLLNGSWVPFRWGMDGIEVLVEDPWDFTKNDRIRVYLKTSKVKFSVAIKEDIEDFIHRLFDEKQNLIAENKQDSFFLPPLKIEGKNLMCQTYLLNTIIADAYLKGATCIHFESPSKLEKSNVLFRMDQVLRGYMTIPEAAADDIVRRIKLMANLDVEDRRLPKIGHIKFKHDGLPEFRLTVTTRPNDGVRETATLRIQTA